MKSIFKKSLAFMMIMFFAVLSLSLGIKVKAAEAARFEFGAYDASKTDESSQDGSSASSYTETVGSYTLTLSSMVKVYKDSYDAKGNSCLKLGTSSASGSFSFTVPSDVTKVGILVAGYKAKTVGISINGGTAQTISTLSSNGEYTEVEVDTSTNKTVSFATGTNKRCKIDAIVFYTAAVETKPSIEITGGDYTEIDDVVTLTATTENVTGTVAWSSSNTDVATVDQSGNVTAKAFGQTTITAAADDVEDSIEFTVYPTDGSELTIAQALQVCQYTGATNCAFEYSITGVIETIDTEYDEGYNNITVTVTDGNDSIKAFRMSGGEDLVVGDKIKVTGFLVNYNGNTPEFAAGCTYEVVADDAATSAIKDALNAIDSYVSAAYKYTKEEVAAPLSVEFVAEELGYENGVAVESISEEPVAIAFAKGENSNAPKYYNTGKAIRCYGGNTMTFTATDTNITSIELTFATGEGTNAISADCGEFDTDTWTGSSATVVLTIGGTTGHRRIASIKVSYEGGSDTKVTQYSDVDFRFKFGVDSDVENIEGVEKVGVSVTAGGEPRFYTSDSFVVDEENGISYIVISLGDIINYSDRASLEFTVSAYVQIGDIKYYSTSSKTYSAKSIIAEYLELGYAVEGLDAIINK